MLKESILSNVPLEVVEKLSDVLRQVQFYNNFEKYSDISKSNLDGSDSLLSLSILADLVYLFNSSRR